MHRLNVHLNPALLMYLWRGSGAPGFSFHGCHFALRLNAYLASVLSRQLLKMSSTKVIIVTGASRGLGLAIAHYLLQRSHKVVAVARSEQPLRELEKQYSGQVAVVAGDLADFSLGQKAVDSATNKWQRLDGVVINHVRIP